MSPSGHREKTRDEKIGIFTVFMKTISTFGRRLVCHVATEDPITEETNTQLSKSTANGTVSSLAIKGIEFIRRLDAELKLAADLRSRLLEKKRRIKATKKQIERDLNRICSSTVPGRRRYEKKQLELERVNAHIISVRRKLIYSDASLNKIQEGYDLAHFHYVPKQQAALPHIPPVDYTIHESFDITPLRGTQAVQEYILEEVVGSGCHGVVWKSFKFCADQRVVVAIKCITKNEVYDEFDKVLQLESELKVLASFSHPNIIGLKEILHGARGVFIVTELAVMDVFKYNAQFGLTERSIRDIAHGVLLAMDHLHNTAKCAHLDIKPENILLAGLPTVANIRLADFGFCQFAHDEKEVEKHDVCHTPNNNCGFVLAGMGTVVGTSGFYAPELTFDRPCDGRIADMWSLGATLLELSSGLPGDWVACYHRHNKSHQVADIEELYECVQRIDNKKKFRGNADLQHLIVDGLLVVSEERQSAKAVLKNPWIRRAPLNHRAFTEAGIVKAI